MSVTVAPPRANVTDSEPEVILRIMLSPGSAIDLFVGDLTRRGYSDRTRATYSRILEKFCDRLPVDYDVSKISPDDCRRFLDSWNNHAAGTRAHTFSVLSSYIGWLHSNDYIIKNPMERLARPKRKRAEDIDVVAVSADDVRKLLLAGDTWTEKLAVAIPAYLGPRRRAVAILRLRDYDTAQQKIRFREKGGKVIWKPVPEELIPLLSAAIADGAIVDPDDYLVPPEGLLVRKGDRDDRVIWRVVKRVAARAGVEATVHALRASFACFYLERNPGDTYGLKELLGHRSFATTQVYLRKLDRGAAMERVRELRWFEVLPDEPDLDPSEVYFIAAGDFAIDGTPVKVGYSGNPHMRMVELQAAHHAELTLVATTPGGLALEAHLHQLLNADHLRGEWFRSSPLLREVVGRYSGMNRGAAANQPTVTSPAVGAGGFEPPFDENPHGQRRGEQLPADLLSRASDVSEPPISALDGVERAGPHPGGSGG